MAKRRGWHGDSRGHSIAAKKGARNRGKYTGPDRRKERRYKVRKVTKGSLTPYKRGGRGYSKSTEYATYLSARDLGKSKKEARKIAVKKAIAVSRRLFKGQAASWKRYRAKKR